jgi:ACS family tartrate transporter-like MFS transporter
VPTPLDTAASPYASTITTQALRKATWRLIPLIGLGYAVAYMDRVNISFAALQMNRDLHFSNTIYGLGAGVFFVSYAACEIPSNLLLYRFGARRWLARIMVTWGIIAMGMVLVRTPAEFYLARFLLGMAEAGFFPGVIFYLMQWFPAHMRARAVTRFYVAFPLSSVLMGAVAGALLNLQGKLGLAGWQWLFLVEALPAVLLGVLFWLYLPDSPHTATWLTEPERQAILSGVERDSAPLDTIPGSILTLLRDPRIWLMGSFMFCMLFDSYAYSFSAPAILQHATGLTTTHVGFLISAMNLIAAAAMLANGTRSDRTGERHWQIIPFCLLAAIGFLLAGLSTLSAFTSITHSSALLVASLTAVVLSISAMQGPLFALPATFLSGKSQAAGIGAMNTIGIAGGFLGPYWMGYARDLTGDYQRGLLTLTAPMLLATAIMLTLRRQALP